VAARRRGREARRRVWPRVARARRGGGRIADFARPGEL